VPADQRRCQHCEDGGTIRSLGDGKECSVIEYVAGFFRRRRFVRETLACTCGQYVVTAPCPDKSTSSEKTRYAPSFVAHLITAKCADAIPLYRLEKIYRRAGIPMARSTMTDLFHRNGRLLLPLAARLLQLIAGAPYVHADETPLRMMGTKKKAYVWTFVAAKLVGFRFSPDRSGKTPSEVLGDSKGSLVVDAYTGYNDVTCPTRRVRGGCLAHARRKIFNARSGAPEANHALAIITEIYRVERDAKEAGIVGTKAHLKMRRARSRPLMDRLRTWLDEQRPLHVPKGPMGNAVGYALDNWTALTRFLDDANVEPDNNKAEAALRRVALGRKNYLHVGNEECGDNIAGLYSLVATCEANDVNPIEYLSDVLARIQSQPPERLDELLPHRWTRAP
ncbi:MAG: IS66 family transposase, partial [Candidatus Binatia bacterium]